MHFFFGGLNKGENLHSELFGGFFDSVSPPLSLDKNQAGRRKSINGLRNGNRFREWDGQDSLPLQAKNRDLEELNIRATSGRNFGDLQEKPL